MYIVHVLFCFADRRSVGSMPSNYQKMAYRTINPSVADSWSETLNACGEGIRPLDAFQSLERSADDGGKLDES